MVGCPPHISNLLQEIKRLKALQANSLRVPDEKVRIYILFSTPVFQHLKGMFMVTSLAPLCVCVRVCVFFWNRIWFNNVNYLPHKKTQTELREKSNVQNKTMSRWVLKR